ncbi:hypothetical protein ABZY93_05025 [Streptomyces smyrnaeus]|uniref:hypothetical protein n=1 Tax=Streptomyces smyrnaeus TaxID=1387713 RepID=UPI0033A28512
MTNETMAGTLIPTTVPAAADARRDALPQLVVDRLGHGADEADTALFSFTAVPTPFAEPALA